MKKNYVSLLVALAALFCMGTSAVAQNNATDVTTIDLTGWFAYNACCDELIVLDGGTMHLRMRTTQNPDGTTTTSLVHSISGVKGTGGSGTSYNFMQKSNEASTYDPNSPAGEYTASVRFKAVGKGKGGRDCSGTLVVTIHYEVDENGNVIVNEFASSWECANGTEIS